MQGQGRSLPCYDLHARALSVYRGGMLNRLLILLTLTASVAMAQPAPGGQLVPAPPTAAPAPTPAPPIAQPAAPVAPQPAAAPAAPVDPNAPPTVTGTLTHNCTPDQAIVIAPGGKVICTKLAQNAAALPNPGTDPVAAWNDAKLARKTSWPLAIWGVLAMLGKLLAYGRDKLKGVPLLGGLASWLSKGKHAMIVAAVGAVGAAGYDVLISGGTLVAALIASVIAVAGIVHSTTQPTPSTNEPPKPAAPVIAVI